MNDDLTDFYLYNDVPGCNACYALLKLNNIVSQRPMNYVTFHQLKRNLYLFFKILGCSFIPIRKVKQIYLSSTNRMVLIFIKHSFGDHRSMLSFSRHSSLYTHLADAQYPNQLVDMWWLFILNVMFVEMIFLHIWGYDTTLAPLLFYFLKLLVQ